MPIEFPYSFVAGTKAKAAEVMADLNVLKAKFDAAITPADLAPGTAPVAASYSGTVPLQFDSSHISGEWDLIGTSEGVSFGLAVKSNVLFIPMVDVLVFAKESTFEVKLIVDGVTIADPAVTLQASGGEGLGGSRSTGVRTTASAPWWVANLAAGSHHVRMIGLLTNDTTGFAEVDHIFLSTLAIPAG